MNEHQRRANEVADKIVALVPDDMGLIINLFYPGDLQTNALFGATMERDDAVNRLEEFVAGERAKDAVIPEDVGAPQCWTCGTFDSLVEFCGSRRHVRICVECLANSPQARPT